MPPVTTPGCTLMEGHNRNDSGSVVTPNQRISTKPVIDVQPERPLATDPHQAAIVANGPLNVGICKDCLDETKG